MLCFNLKKCWHDAILSGEKRIEYRVVKPYWEKRLSQLHAGTPVIFRCGYGHSKPTINARVISIDRGPCPYPGWDGEYFRIRFACREDYPGIMDPTKYYPGFGVDDMNIGDYYEQKWLLEDDEPDGIGEYLEEDEVEWP